MADKYISIGNLEDLVYYDDSEHPYAVETNGVIRGSIEGTVIGHADRAGDADTVDGKHASDFAKASSLVEFTPEGGLAVRLYNRTGAVSVKGSLVAASNSYDNSFKLVTANTPDCIGAVYESGVANGSLCWVVVAGIAKVLIVNGTTATRGYWAKVSDTVNGRAVITNALPPGGTITALEDHLSEIGHCLETKSAGTDVLVKVLIHFN